MGYAKISGQYGRLAPATFRPKRRAASAEHMEVDADDSRAVASPFRVTEVLMQWWLSIVLVIAVVALLVSLMLMVQARRRRGGVIVDPAAAPGPRRRGRRS